MILGLAGACKREDLAKLRLEDVNDEGHFFRFVIPNRKTRNYRQFFITPGDIEGLNFVEIIRKYARLRPDNTEHGRFFFGYRNGVCTRQPVGKNAFGAMAKEIATFLKLENPEQYTGHCFRRSSTTSQGDSPGANLLNVVKRKSNSAGFDGYREDSVRNRRVEGFYWHR